MCGGGGNTTNNSVTYQRQEERKRQQRIAQGKAQLEQIFSGLEGRGPTNPNAGRSFQDYAREKKAGSTIFNQYMPGSGFMARGVNQMVDKNEDSILDAYKRDVLSPDNYEQSGQPIWEQQQRAYLDYAQPQLEDQFGDAQDELTFALSRQGQGKGSLAGDRRADLNRDYDLRRQEVADKARGVATQARGDIANQKQSLLQMLSASADPGATASAARSAVSSLSSTPEFSPLGPLFQNTTAGLAQGMQGMQNQKMNEQVQGITYGGDPDRGSGRVIR